MRNQGNLSVIVCFLIIEFLKVTDLCGEKKKKGDLQWDNANPVNQTRALMKYVNKQT